MRGAGIELQSGVAPVGAAVPQTVAGGHENGAARGVDHGACAAPDPGARLRAGRRITRQVRATGAALDRMRLERDRRLVDRFLANRHRFVDWGEGRAMFSSSAARLTKREFARFTEEYVRLLKRYWRPEEKMPPGAKPIVALFYAFPWPGE